MGLEARLLLGHCSPRLSALSGPSRIGPTDHFEGIRASHIKGQTLVEMAGTHHRSHIMENVTLTPKEQSRLQVLNSLAAEHMTLDQAAELMGVTSRHTRRILAAYRDPGLVEALVAGRLVGHVGQRYLDNVIVEIGTVTHSDDHQICPVIIRVVRIFVVLCGGESQLPRRSDGEMFPVGAERCQIAVQCPNQKVACGVLVGSGQCANRRGSFRHRE